MAVGNSNADPANNPLKFIFTTNITLNSSSDYFLCSTPGIQFGSTSLKNDGTRPIIYIDTTTDYNGVIFNTLNSGNGHNNIYVFNLEVRAINGAALDSDGGWICQPYFGKGATNNYIINCASDGPIIDGGGGIVGGYSGSELGASLYIIGCSSSGETATYSGGIIGFYAGQNGGAVTCENCWSTGLISGARSGGIFGYYAGDNGGVVRAIQCYSSGAISGQYSGGIYGQFAGNASTAEATKCYSQGAIGTDAGGIFGASAGSDGGLTPATNCYSSGSYPTLAGTGIYGPNAVDDNPVHCYSADGSWSDATANTHLVGTPNPVVGTTWVASGGTNYPYELKNMGYTPYTFTNIVFEGVGGTPVLKQSYSQPVVAGVPSNAAIRNGYSYDKMSITGGDPGSYETITVNSNSGIISSTSSTAPGVYSIVIRNTGSYNITTFNLTVLGSGPTPTANICFPAGTPILTDQGNLAIEQINEFVHTIGNKKIVAVVKTKSTDDYLVCFEKDSLGTNVPSQRTLVSGEHGIMFKGKMRKAKCFLAKFQRVGKVRYNGETLYNVLMEEHNAMLVNNLVCETLNPNNAIAKLHMHLRRCPPAQQRKIVDKHNECMTGEQNKKKKKMNINHYVSTY